MEAVPECTYTQAMRHFISIMAVLLLTTMPALADFNDGLDAYNQGDYETALTEWRPLAEEGNAEAQFNLGALYDEGEGVQEDYAEAAKWYRLAAEQGNAEAQSNLGALYDEGDGVRQDYAEAAKWYRLAAEQGHAAGSDQSRRFVRTRAMAYQQGYAEAVKWCQLAADQGDAGAQYNLGGLYDEGEMVSSKTMQKPRSGAAWRPNRGTPQLRPISAFCATRAMACRRTTPRQ